MSAPKRTERVTAWMRPHERAAVERAAQVEKKRIGEYARDVLLADARRRLETTQAAR